MTYVQLWWSPVYENLSRSEVLKKTWLYRQAQFKPSQEKKAREDDTILTVQQGQTEHTSELRL